MRRRNMVPLTWLAAAVVLSLGAAGIVTAVDHLPGGSGRPELTWSADSTVADDLEEAAADLAVLGDAVGVLGEDGREALAALVGRDVAALAAAIAAGSAQLDVIDAVAATLEADLAQIPIHVPDRAIRYSAATIARYDELVAGIAAVEPLRPAWERLAAGVMPAVELTDHLLAHDQVAGEAIQLGGAGEYQKAITRIGKASAELDAARTIRDRLAATADVATLDQWIERNAAYDEALHDLWDALRRSRGRVTDTVRDAAARERAAKDQLPPDARALVVILGDVARGGLNQAVISIEEARGALLAAHARAVAIPSPTAGEPTPVPIQVPTQVPSASPRPPGARLP